VFIFATTGGHNRK